MLRLIDVSSHQPQIDWGQVAVNYAGAFVKATGGTGYANPNYHEQIAGARGAGLVTGHYHYGWEGTVPSDPAAEAAHFLAHADVQPGELVALDIEEMGASGDLSTWALTWLRIVEAALGFKPFVYSFPNYIETRGLGTAALAGYPLWYAYYRTPYAMGNWPATPGAWPKVTLWQWSGGTFVPGVAGDTDDNLFDGTREELIALGKPGLAPPPTPPAPPVVVYPSVFIRMARSLMGVA